MEPPIKKPEKIKLAEINPYLTCYLCKGYLIDATTISECLHSFCRSCIIKFLQDNSYCPVCEVIINKAKPNLKLDKTLQDIVYKLVPELFLREMTRRKVYYQQYPQIAARVSPEERGEDIERTIFNPQDCISLSMEYVSDDSTPGAISLIDSKNGLDKKQLAEDTQALMKRYLQCPGMCRIEVLKKFVRNKYNVDTSLFYIDILYKKVPLPDHYTLIDIAYIYSWKRNEPMKFYFRIIDINKVSERFDHFNSQTPLDFVKTPIKTPRSNGDRSVSHKRRESAGKRSSRICKQPSQENITICDAVKADLSPKSQSNLEIRCESDVSQTSTESESKTISNKENKIIDNKENEKIYDKHVEPIPKVPPERPCHTNIPEEPLPAVEEKKSSDLGPKPKQKEDSSSSNPCDTTNKDNNVLGVQNMLLKSEIADQIKQKIQTEKSDVKNAVYTNITLNRTNNVEIITKIQKVSNKDGRPIGLNIIKQTVKKSSKGHSDSNVATKPTKKLTTIKPQTSNKNNNPQITHKPATKPIKGAEVTSTNNNNTSLEDEEKMRFLKSIELTAKTVAQDIDQKQKESPQPSGGQKRKNSSPVKNDKGKKFKLDQQKPTTKIIIQSKPKAITSQPVNQMKSNGLQSLIENCKIPSSLSITIKEGTDNNRLPALIPPVKNYIEILKLPDENGQANDKSASTPTKLDFNMICDNDSEQKVDEDLSEIAKSLTEKIPMSTTISQIVGPKPQFPIPVKSNVPVKFNIQPSPVPEVPSKMLNIPKENKLNPRSPQTFQKIFEESIKKPDGSTSPERDDQKLALDLSNDASCSTNSNNNTKRNILEIASQLYKKTKLEQEKKNSEVKVEEVATPVPIPKVPIPRLPNQRNLKPPQKNMKFELTDPMKYPVTLTNLHSNALGLNYTISIGHNAGPKKNGIVTPPKKEEIKPPSPAIKASPTPVPGKDLNVLSSPAPFATPRDIPSASPRPSPIPRNLSPGVGYHSPRNSPKHSPKSSPLVKHMYAPMPNLMMDQQLRVHTYNQKIPSPKMSTFSKSPKLPSPSTSTSSKLPSPSSKKSSAISPRLPNLSPNLSPVAGSSPKLHHPLPSTSPKLLSLPELTSPCPSVKHPSKTSPGGSQSSPLSPNQILEKYNIQNLAQLTASLNFNAGNFGMNPTNQLAALQHAMLLKHFEMQNRQNWLNMNQGPLLQYEKYLQSLKNNQNHLLSKEN